VQDPSITKKKRIKNQSVQRSQSKVLREGAKEGVTQRSGRRMSFVAGTIATMALEALWGAGLVY
jgi:hypothetical protein